jgi:hypothetical protein
VNLWRATESEVAALSVDLLSILKCLPDMRRREGKRYPLAGVLLFSILAMLSGANSYRRIHDVMSARLDLFNEAFPSVALARAPAYTSLRNILLGIDAEALETAFRSHAALLLGDVQGSLAVDGKVLRGSFDAFSHQKAVQVLSVFSTVDQIILAHVEVSEKTNEIPKAQALFGELALSDRLFTLDAMHCQKNI